MPSNPVTRLKMFTCPQCHYQMDAATGLRPDWRPEPGDYSLCMNCGAVNVFDETMQVRRPTEAEEKMCLASASGPEVLWARAEIRRRGPIPGTDRRA